MRRSPAGGRCAAPTSGCAVPVLPGPVVIGFPGDLPFLPLPQDPVQLGADGFHIPLVFLVDDVDLGVVGDVAQGDVGHALVHETLADVAVGGHLRRVAAGQLGLLDLPVPAVRQDVVGVAGAHDAGAGQGQGDAGGVDGDPPPPPLLRHVGGGARTTGGVQHQVSRIGGHQDAALDTL